MTEPHTHATQPLSVICITASLFDFGFSNGVIFSEAYPLSPDCFFCHMFSITIARTHKEIQCHNSIRTQREEGRRSSLHCQRNG